MAAITNPDVMIGVYGLMFEFMNPGSFLPDRPRYCGRRPGGAAATIAVLCNTVVLGAALFRARPRRSCRLRLRFLVFRLALFAFQLLARALVLAECRGGEGLDLLDGGHDAVRENIGG